jgi:membrane protease YdiL (CAAX protease family)
VLGYIGSADLLTLALCFLQYIPAGLCLAWAYDASGSIFAPVLIHTVINALGILSLR